MLSVQKRKHVLGSSQSKDSIKRSKFQNVQQSESEDETDEEEKDLEAFLFGNTNNLVKETVQYKTKAEVEENNDDILGFTISAKPDDTTPEQSAVADFTIEGDKEKAAWVDDDDENLEVDIGSTNRLKKLKSEKNEQFISGNKFQQRLKAQFEKILPKPAWADLENASANDHDSDSDESEDNVLLSSKRATVKSQELPQGIINISKLRNLNKVESSSSTITSLEFHPHSKIAITTSLNKRLSIFQADGTESRKLQSVFLANFPIYTGHFTPSGEKVIMTSRRKFFYVYDLMEGKVIKVPEIRGRDEKSLEKFVISPDGDTIAFLGKNGYLNLVSSKTFHLITSFKMNGGVYAASFSPDGNRLYSAGSDGEVYLWNINQRKCEHRFIDDGSLKTKCIAVSQNQKYIATGSSSGVVNIYDEGCLTTKHPSPVKILKNLTTSIDGLAFNSTSEILAYFSPQARNSIRLAHFPSLTNFSNWPVEKQTLGNVSCIGFSPHSGYLGIGNEKGQARLFRLKHYPSS